MLIAWANPDDLREQDENARVMPQEMLNQLAVNIKRRGMIESLPYCAATERGVEIVSGHHRVLAAKAACLKEIPILLDMSGLSRSAIAAKQLGHNNIAGTDDADVVRRIVAKIQDVNDMLEAYLPKTLNVEPAPVDLDKLLAPHVKFEWKTVTLIFLPHQFTQFKEFADSLAGSHDLIGVTTLPWFKPFVEAMTKYGRFKGVIALGMVVAALTQLAKQEMAAGLTVEELFNDQGELKEAWVPLAAVIGTEEIPTTAAVVLRKALDQMLADGTITKKNLWQGVEYLAAEWLAGAPKAMG
jgi:hypothetical protein